MGAGCFDVVGGWVPRRPDRHDRIFAAVNRGDPRTGRERARYVLPERTTTLRDLAVGIDEAACAFAGAGDHARGIADLAAASYAARAASQRTGGRAEEYQVRDLVLHRAGERACDDAARAVADQRDGAGTALHPAPQLCLRFEATTLRAACVHGDVGADRAIADAR